MRLRQKAADAVSEVKETASRIGENVQWSTTALVTVSVVSLVALIVAGVALSRSR